MGCTSSSPNMVTAHANPTDKIIHFSEDTTNDRHNDELNSSNDANEKVLPACDTLVSALNESIQLVRNNKSITETSHGQGDKDAYTNEYDTDGDNTLIYKEDSQLEEKFSSLEDVVEKVVELYIADAENTIDIAKNVSESSAELTNTTYNNIDEKVEESSKINFSHIDNETTEIIEEKLEEAISPSQSTSSRATRWEALADIAAELPPSLAVDPVTGQIYALSK
ncbi:uncharacterized protein LOC128673062 [Plodia interpunctella]|uniref:uncharacterized protein LOC128673062 n=1 Tax=Plodia interpunctella TaxID=58824 RepID=UPI002368124D|nr:uncharacterized protein LOC128673062 [Plodia interpunctella]